MKKTAIIIILQLIFKICPAQIDMITALKTIGEDVVYTEYWGVTKEGNGKYSISGKRYVATLKPALNRFGKIVGFDAIDVKDRKAIGIKYYYMHGWFDHYTHPSYFLYKDSNTGYVIVNGVIIEFEKFESIDNFVVDGIWFPKVPKEKKGEALFQGSSMGDFKSVDIMQLVKDYFAAMKKLQDANPLNEANQQEADVMKFAYDSTIITYKQTNANYWSSPEGQKKLAQLRKPNVIVMNDTGADFCFCSGQGVSTILRPGEKREMSCNGGQVYLGEKVPNSTNLKKTNILLIDLNGNNCGTTVMASSLIR